jgi:hypothetical protein
LWYTPHFKPCSIEPILVVKPIGKNTHSEDFNSTIDIEWNHNHPIQSLHSLSFKDIPTRGGGGGGGGGVCGKAREKAIVLV